MADKTKIQWTEATWNPVIGCQRVSEGCRNCYAEVQARRIALMHQNSAYSRVLRHDHDGLPLPMWRGNALPMPDRLDQPLRWAKPRLIFVNSMSDLFHHDVPFEYIAAVFGVMAASPRHTFQVLTKRPQRALEFFKWLDYQAAELMWAIGENPPSGSPNPSACAYFVGSAYTPERDMLDALTKPGFRAAMAAPWPLPNVWLGVSVEDQATADERVPLLLQCPAAVRWVSAEPLLGPINFDARSMGCVGHLAETFGNPLLHWIVVGGESGQGARTCQAEWLRAVVRQCAAAQVPCFVKQLGAAYEDPENGIAGHALHARMNAETRSLVSRVLRHPKGGDIEEWPEALRVREWPLVETEAASC